MLGFKPATTVPQGLWASPLHWGSEETRVLKSDWSLQEELEPVRLYKYLRDRWTGAGPLSSKCQPWDETDV